MLYAVRTRDGRFVGDVFGYEVIQTDCPTICRNIDQAQVLWRRCPSEWEAEVVKIHISWSNQHDASERPSGHGLDQR